MKIDEWTSEDVRNQGGGESPTCAGLASNALPEAQSIISAESSQTGVSTRNARSETMFQPQKQGEIPAHGEFSVDCPRTTNQIS